MEMTRKRWVSEILGFKGEIELCRESIDPPWVKQIFTKVNDMENDETKRYQADIDLFRGS